MQGRDAFDNDRFVQSDSSIIVTKSGGAPVIEPITANAIASQRLHRAEKLIVPNVVEWKCWHRPRAPEHLWLNEVVQIDALGRQGTSDPRREGGFPRQGQAINC